MFRARREALAACAVLIFVGCGGERTALSPATPVAPRDRADAPDAPAPAVPAEDAIAEDAPPSSPDHPEPEAPVAQAPLPPALRLAFERKRSTREALAAALGGKGATDDRQPPELGPAFEAMVEYCKLAFGEAESLGDEDRNLLLKRVVREIGDDFIFYRAHDQEGVALRLQYELGRAHALAGDVDRACRKGFDPIIECSAAGLDAPAREWIENLKLYAYYMKAKTQFGAGRYDAVLTTVEGLFAEFPASLDTDQGNGALLLKAEALALKHPPDRDGAIREATRVIEHAKGYWPNNANQLLAKILDAPPQADIDTSMSPKELLQSARGAVQLATNAEDPTERQRLMELAVNVYRRAISACAGSGIALRERLEVESSAWFELGIVYSKLDLWYEASFAFEAVMARFPKACVGRMLAGESRMQPALAEVRRRIASGEVVADWGEDPPDENELLYDEAAETPEWSETLKKVEERFRKSANNLMVSARRRHSETRSEFDQKRLDAIFPGDPDPARVRDLDFHRGLLSRAEAEGHAMRGEVRKAIEKRKEASRLFLETAGTNEARREIAYHLAGRCLLEAAKATLALARGEPGLEAEAKRLGHGSHRAFVAFEREVASAGPKRGEPDMSRQMERLRIAAEAKAEIEKLFGAPPPEE